MYEVGFTTEDEDEPIAFARMDERIHKILEGVRNYTEETILPGLSYQCYLSDSKENNFRYKIDPEYKGHRVQPKPRHYEVLKEYLIVEHGAKIAYGMEADDALGIAQDKDLESLTTVICSIDKDLSQIPGYHYSWPINRGGIEIRPEKFWITNEDEGILFFWKQMLVGDTADNIKGIKGIGKVGADKLLTSGMFEEELYDIVSSMYIDEDGDLSLERFHKNRQLLLILQHDKEG